MTLSGQSLFAESSVLQPALAFKKL
jgi:hypothetical protein